jgi:hypothetical protein
LARWLFRWPQSLEVAEKMSDGIGVDPKTQALLDKIGSLSDRADNLAHAARMPGLSASIHLSGMTSGLADIRDELREAYKGFSGQDPWSESTDDGDD